MAGTIRIGLDFFCEDLEEDGKCFEVSGTKAEKKQKCGAVCCMFCPDGEEGFYNCKKRCKKIDLSDWMSEPPMIILKNMEVLSPVKKWVKEDK